VTRLARLHDGGRRVRLGLSVLSSVLVVAVLGGCAATSDALPSDAQSLADRLNQAVASRDEAAFDSLFTGQTNAGTRGWTWQNLVALPQVRFTPGAQSRLDVAWRAPGDTLDATQQLGQIACDASGCSLTDIGPQQGWPAPVWAVQPLSIVTGDHATVLAGSGDATAGQWLDAAVAARAAVATVELPGPAAHWDGTLVLELPRDTSAFAQVLGLDSAADFATTGAITWVQDTGQASPQPGGGPSAAVHVVVNPATGPGMSAGQRVLLLTHEAVHVATAGWQLAPGATWVSEGLAENVAVAGDPSTSADETTRARAACTPAGLSAPADDAFTSGDVQTVNDAYAVAQVLVGLIRARLGDAAPQALWSMGEGQNVPQVDLPAWSQAWCAG